MSYDEFNSAESTASENEDFLDIDTSDAIEPTAVEDGEYKIRITGLRKKEGKIISIDGNGNRYFMVNFDIPSEAASKGISKFFGLPSDELDAKKNNSNKWELECFKKAFNLTEINFNSMIGREGYAILTREETQEYGAQNKIKKFITGA